jgi:hypothetical protein
VDWEACRRKLTTSNQLDLPKSSGRYLVQTRSPPQECFACRLQVVIQNTIIGDLCDKHGKMPVNYAIVKSCIKGSFDPIAPFTSPPTTMSPFKQFLSWYLQLSPTCDATNRPTPVCYYSPTAPKVIKLKLTSPSARSMYFSWTTLATSCICNNPIPFHSGNSRSMENIERVRISPLSSFKSSQVKSSQEGIVQACRRWGKRHRIRSETRERNSDGLNLPPRTSPP